MNSSTILGSIVILIIYYFMTLETIIGLEIHIQLKTKSKMFCGCSNLGENERANTTVCPICLGYPGTLPVANQAAVDMGVIMALGLNCKRRIVIP